MACPFTMTFPSGHASAGTVVPLKWRKNEQPINIYIKPVLDDKTIKKYVHQIARDIIYRTPYTLPYQFYTERMYNVTFKNYKDTRLLSISVNIGYRDLECYDEVCGSTPIFKTIYTLNLNRMLPTKGSPLQNRLTNKRINRLRTILYENSIDELVKVIADTDIT